MIDSDVDVLIIGGGVIGSALVRALAPLKLKVLLADDKPIIVNAASFDARSIALSNASIQILKMLEIWPSLTHKYTSIENIHISEKGVFGHTRLLGDKKHPLGAVVEMNDLTGACSDTLGNDVYLAPAKLIAFDVERNQATLQTATQTREIRARIVVGADGSDSFLRQCCGLSATKKDYHQTALVANIGLARSHHYTAYERFTTDGPMAMLPLSAHRASLIWVNSPAQSTHLYQLSDDLFLQALQRTFGYRLGRFVKVGQRALYPLYQRVMPEKTINSVVFIGNAAQTLHPIAGQGFNLGLRDVAMLVQCISQYGLNPKAIEQYQLLRRPDEHVITQGTDSLITLFKSKFPCISIARGLGLIAMDNSAILQGVLSRYASGYGGVVPDLVCGIQLSEITPPQHTQ